MSIINSATVMYGCRHRTTRKRKPDEIDKELSEALSKIESDAFGPFWFQKSTSLMIRGSIVHVGLQQREKLELKELVRTKFITEEFLRYTLVPLNDESSSVPRLRMYNWAVTNYAKGKAITTRVVDKDGNVRMIDPSISYNSTLKKLHRPLFDPYRRGTLLFFRLDNDTTSEETHKDEEKKDDSSLDQKDKVSDSTSDALRSVHPTEKGTDLKSVHPTEKGTDLKSVHHTTVGQLLFVKWCIENGVDKYVEAHEEEIRKHLNDTAKARALKGKGRVKELTETTFKYARVIPTIAPSAKRSKTDDE